MASLIEGRPLTAEPWLSPGSQPHISGLIRRWVAQSRPDRLFCRTIATPSY